VNERDFEKLLSIGHEVNGVEFKGRGSRIDSAFRAKVTRAILAMANRRDGGLVIIGVDSESTDAVGLSDDEARTWLNFDELSASVNAYASPSVRLDVEKQIFQDRIFVIIRVHEFDDIPILCTKNYSEPGRKAPILEDGACYVRSRHKPETRRIPSEEEMRELLDLAIDKGVRKFLTRAQKAGLLPPTLNTSDSPPDEAKFELQIEEME
jgi:predicted HTH transcriptional regulator